MTTGPQDSPVWPPSPASASPAGPLPPASSPPPGWGAPQDLRPAAGPEPERIWTVLSNTKRTGQWLVPPRLVVSCALGEVRIDLREAQFTSRTTEIEVRGLMGEVKIIVPDVMRVHVTGSPILAEFREKEAGETSNPPLGAPELRVTGSMVMGEVTVWRTADPVGSGAFGVDGLKGVRQRRRRRRAHGTS